MLSKIICKVRAGTLKNPQKWERQIVKRCKNTFESHLWQRERDMRYCSHMRSTMVGDWLKWNKHDKCLSKKSLSIPWLHWQQWQILQQGQELPPLHGQHHGQGSQQRRRTSPEVCVVKLVKLFFNIVDCIEETDDDFFVVKGGHALEKGYKSY